MEYKILEADGEAQKLEEMVNSHIADGWEPIGGLCVVNSHSLNTWWYYQAMIRRSKTAAS
jgi:hypothetical protein